MEFVLLIGMAGLVGWLLWQLTAGAGEPGWAEAPEIEAGADLGSLHATPDERPHRAVAATLLVLSVLVVAFGVAAGVYWAGRFVFGQLGQMLGL